MTEYNVADPHNEFATHRELGEAIQAIKSENDDTYVNRTNAKKVFLLWGAFLLIILAVFAFAFTTLFKAVDELNTSVQELEESVANLGERVDALEDEVEELKVTLRTVDVYYYQQIEAAKERLLEIEYEFGWITDEDLQAIGSDYMPVLGPEYSQSPLEDLTPTDLPSMSN